MRATVAEIDLSAIAFNLEQVKNRVAPARVMAVVKANAYGHGAVQVARTALAHGAEYLAVALVEEGAELREAGIRAPILVFGGFFPEQVREFLDHDLDLTLYSEEQLQALTSTCRQLGRRARVHIKVDTGMGRVGVPYGQAVAFVRRAVQQPELEVVGLYTHFATSDERDKAYANLQLERFQAVVNELERERLRPPIVHAANSGAILDMPATYFDMVRPGIMLYGYYPSRETSESLPLRPAMTLKSKIIHLKSVPKGTPVSYGRKYIAPRDTKIATIPLGYADGYNRQLTNRGWVSVRNRPYPVVGRVCMDQILVDVGPGGEVSVGDEVILFGPGLDPRVSVDYITDQLDTIPYEVCCWVSYRVPRVFVNEKTGG